MKIVIASGKGGTGKTTVATNLAVVASTTGHKTAYLDCDVEEPNGHIFLKPEITARETVGIPVPKVDKEKCISCGKCAKVCRYSAIVCIKETVIVNPSMCHGCGGCGLVCPAQAIQEESWPIGVLEKGRSGDIEFIQGILNVGIAISPPLIRAVKSAPVNGDITFLDAPPGTSCPVVETVRDSDYVVLVTEPTPFGLNDLKLAVEMVRVLSRPLGVVINRSDTGTEEVGRYCQDQEIEVLGCIPDDRKIAEAYSRGLIASRVMAGYAGDFKKILDRILRAVRTCTEGAAR
jgi:MinD superfamily P-loop ATPase